MQQQPPTLFLIVYLKLKNTISIRKFHDVWREANHATTSQLNAYIDAVVGNTTQGSVENGPQPSFVDNSFYQAKFKDRASAFNRGIIGYEQTQATPNFLSLPTTGISNSFQGAEVSNNAMLFNGCSVSKDALKVWAGYRAE